LHIAAAAYRTELVRALLRHGADVHAANRLKYQPIHSAAVGIAGAPSWNSAAQSATIRMLIDAGAGPNATDKRGVSPLLQALRTRCAAAVRTLLECGADPARRNSNGSTPLLLANKPTGRGGSGSAEAKTERQEIVRLLRQALAKPATRK
jgi:ankyrin repeat protein